MNADSPQQLLRTATQNLPPVTGNGWFNLLWRS